MNEHDEYCRYPAISCECERIQLLRDEVIKNLNERVEAALSESRRQRGDAA